MTTCVTANVSGRGEGRGGRQSRAALLPPPEAVRRFLKEGYGIPCTVFLKSPGASLYWGP